MKVPARAEVHAAARRVQVSRVFRLPVAVRRVQVIRHAIARHRAVASNPVRVRVKLAAISARILRSRYVTITVRFR